MSLFVWFKYKCMLSFTDMNTMVVYLQVADNEWISYKPVPSPLHNIRTTRQTKTWHHKESTSPSDPIFRTLVLTTIYTDTRFPGYFQIVRSSTGIRSAPPQLPNNSIWNFPPIDNSCLDTPEFYQRII